MPSAVYCNDKCKELKPKYRCTYVRTVESYWVALWQNKAPRIYSIVGYYYYNKTEHTKNQ